VEFRQHENGSEKWSLKIPDDSIQFPINKEQEDDAILSMGNSEIVIISRVIYRTLCP
jgi:hypothetical protein